MMMDPSVGMAFSESMEFPRSKPINDLGMGFFDHQSYDFLGLDRSLGDDVVDG